MQVREVAILYIYRLQASQAANEDLHEINETVDNDENAAHCRPSGSTGQDAKKKASSLSSSHEISQEFSFQAQGKEEGCYRCGEKIVVRWETTCQCITSCH